MNKKQHNLIPGKLYKTIRTIFFYDKDIWENFPLRKNEILLFIGDGKNLDSSLNNLAFLYGDRIIYYLGSIPEYDLFETIKKCH